MSQHLVNGTWYEEVDCYSCGVHYLIPAIIERNAKAHRGPNGRNIHCPNGHSWHYVGETEADKMRRERDIAKQQLARVEDEAREARRRAEKAEKATRLLKKRAAAGTCPCCQRTFSNMNTHMRKQHPEYVAENVVQIKRA
jgi:hypothetical protein